MPRIKRPRSALSLCIQAAQDALEAEANYQRLLRIVLDPSATPVEAANERLAGYARAWEAACRVLVSTRANTTAELQAKARVVLRAMAPCYHAASAMHDATTLTYSLVTDLITARLPA